MRATALSALVMLSVGIAQAQPTIDLPAEFADWDAFVTQELVRWKVPGVAMAIVKDGKIVLARGYGLRDIERQLPMTESTVQPIASTTKSFTVAALATLVRDGQLKWDEPVREYLPDFRLHSDYATQTVTVRDLLTHRSGMPRHDRVWYGSSLSREQLYQRLRYLPLSAEPRARFQYNNLMYMTAGYLGGKRAGSDWEGLVRDRLLLPMGMASTSFTLAELKRAADHGSGYVIDDQYRAQPKAYAELTAMGPTGSMNSNARDMAQYLLMLTGGGSYGGKMILTAADLRTISTGHMSLPDPRLWPELSNPQYGMGWFVTGYRGVSLVDHGGNLPGAATTLAFVPGHNIGVYATVNEGSSPLRDVIKYAVIDRLLKLQPVNWSERLHANYLKSREAATAAREQKLVPGKQGTRPALALSEYAGDYEHPGYGTLRITQAGDALTLQFNGMSTPLPHLHYEVFQAPRSATGDLSELRVQFLSNFDGDTETLRIEIEPSVRPVEFKRQPDPHFREASYLKRLTGLFTIGQTEFNVVLRPDGVLTLAGRTGPALELRGLRGHRFEILTRNGAQVEFLPDAQGVFTRLVQHQGGTSVLAQRRP